MSGILVLQITILVATAAAVVVVVVVVVDVPQRQRLHVTQRGRCATRTAKGRFVVTPDGAGRSPDRLQTEVRS